MVSAHQVRKKVYSFTPTVTGIHTLQVTSTSSSGYIDYFFKAASGGCGATGWSCILDIFSPITTTIGTLTAGVQYYILLDAETTTSVTQTFKINCPCPTASISLGLSPAVCSGTTTANLPYTATTGTPNQYSIDYNPAAEAAGFVDVNNVALPASPIVLTVPAAAAPATYNATVTVVNSVSGCPASAAVPFTVTVNPAPAATITYAGTPYCGNAGIANVTQTGTAGGTYSATPAGLTLNAGNGDVTLGTSTAGTYTVTYTIAASGGCGTFTATGTITVNPIPDVAQPANQVVCNNTMTAPVNFTGAVPGTVFNWTNSNPSIGLAATGTGDIASFMATNAGAVPVVATVTVTPQTGASGSATFNYTGAIQNWTVPPGVTSVNIDAFGAQGGNTNGGLGAQLAGTFAVTPGEVLAIAVGQQGSVNNCGGPGASGGGGGGSFIWRISSPSVPMLVAGAGGGGNTNWSGGCIAGINASITQNGTQGNGALSALGGSARQWRFGNAPSGTGSGGGGWLTAGQNSTFGTGCTGGQPAFAFTGGSGSTSFGPGGDGGFGGGGGAVCGCGGGGGYSGGGGGEGSTCRAGGGGGGSYNAGTSQVNTAGVRSGNGLVTITYAAGPTCVGPSKPLQ
ncbi:MAG: hypothetical protein IPL84_00445 [Chitinophagaceae bacterium]|nr:hypothetical protein [Chitinophagaceae bacterium]